MDNPPAALFNEMTRGFVGGLSVVDQDAGAARMFFHPIEKDHGRIFFEERFILTRKQSTWYKWLVRNVVYGPLIVIPGICATV